VDGLVEAVAQIGRLSRRDCRLRVEALFSDDVVVDGYLAVYDEMVGSGPRGGGAGARPPSKTVGGR
jgi:hypothetical protein